MADRAEPVARSTVPVVGPTAVVAGWLVSTRRSDADLTLVDCTPVSKALVRAPPAGRVADHLDVTHGTCRRESHGHLVIGTGPGEWLVVAAAGHTSLASETAAAVAAVAGPGELATVVDVTHGRVVLRLTGVSADRLLARVCALDLSTSVFQDGRAARTSVAGVVTEVVRDDSVGRLSLLVSCEASSGRYLFDSLLDAGRSLGIEVAGFDPDAHP